MNVNHKDMSKKRFGAHTAIYQKESDKKRGFKEYRKKPLIIQAKQMSESFEVVTLEGKMTGKAGDYLIIGIEGESYPCDKTVFELTYELVEGEQEK